jgi:hypothetical protein
MTVFDGDTATRLTIWIKLYAVPRDVRDVTVADVHITPTAGDAMGIVLVLERAAQQMMNAAVFDQDPFTKDADTISAAIEDLAVSQGDIVCGDFDDVAAFALRIDAKVFIHTWLCDLQSMHELRLRVRAHFTRGSSEFGRIGSKRGRYQ